MKSKKSGSKLKKSRKTKKVKVKKSKNKKNINKTNKENASEKKAQKELQNLNQLFSTFSFYPVAVGQEKKEITKRKIIQEYRKGKDYICQNILHFIYENLMQYSEMKNPMNYAFFKSKTPEESPQKIKMSVYRSMFNYNSSLEGSLFMISFLAELGDTASAKLLTHLFNYYSGKESERFRIFRNAVIDALAESNSPYALSSLLSYVEHVDSERLLHRIVGSLAKWDEKLKTLKIPENEKKELKKHLGKFLSALGTDAHEGYVR